ncbi:MAG: hypothetical protein PVJ39_17460 [Gammaproteobacteria bacterium]|jgi:hypothetical protein
MAFRLNKKLVVLAVAVAIGIKLLGPVVFDYWQKQIAMDYGRDLAKTLMEQSPQLSLRLVIFDKDTAAIEYELATADTTVHMAVDDIAKLATTLRNGFCNYVKVHGPPPGSDVVYVNIWNLPSQGSKVVFSRMLRVDICE